MLRRVVRSHGIISVGYDDAAEELEVELPGNYVYRYQGVPRAIYERLVTAPSLGTFFNDSIRDAFPCVRVDEQRKS